MTEIIHGFGPKTKCIGPGKHTEMRVELLSSEDDPEVVEFLNVLGRSQSGTFVLGYHYPENREMLQRVLNSGTRPCNLAARSHAGHLIGFLPGMIHTTSQGACYNSLPFFGPNVGVLASTDDPRRYADIAYALTLNAIDLARQAGALTAVFISPFNPTATQFPNPSFEGIESLVRVPKSTLSIELPSDSEPPWPASRRYDIRKAGKSGVTATEGPFSFNDINAIYGIYERNCEERNIPKKPFGCISFLCSEGVADRVATYVGRLEGRIIAALIVFLGPRTASYYMPCVDAEYRSFQPLPLLIDTACRSAMRRGITHWNWESSPTPEDGVYRFKKKWGSVESRYDVTLVRFCPIERLRGLGAAGLASQFPFYYVYPYDQL